MIRIHWFLRIAKWCVGHAKLTLERKMTNDFDQRLSLALDTLYETENLLEHLTRKRRTYQRKVLHVPNYST